MDATRSGDGRMTLSLGLDELRLLALSMREFCNGPHARHWDGEPVREAYALYAALANALAELEQTGGDRGAPV